MPIQQICKIISTERTGGAVRMVLAAGNLVSSAVKSGGRPVRPGQFIHIKCGDAQLLRRPISICSWTGSRMGDTLTIVFEVRGEGTAWLAERQTGDALDVLGPLGNGFQMKPGPYLLVGGGIGVPPMVGCAAYSGGCSTAILGFRSRDKAILLDEFAENCADYQVATDDGSLGYHGFVDALVRRELETERRYLGVLACGPKPMLKSVAKAAAEFGLPCQVSMEERMGCGVGACLVCAVPQKDGSMKHACKDGPVFDAEEVDWDA